MIKQNQLAFDDFTTFDTFEEFIEFIDLPNTLSLEIGNGIGLCTFTFAGNGAIIQLVLYDFNYRPYLVFDLCALAFEFGIGRITSFATEDRDYAKYLALMVGCKYEGTIRKAFLRAGKYYDVDMFGVLRKEFIKWPVLSQQPPSVQQVQLQEGSSPPKEPNQQPQQLHKEEGQEFPFLDMLLL